MKEAFKTTRYEVESKHAIEIAPDMPIRAHIGRYNALMRNYYRIRPSGKTAYEEAFDSSYNSEMVKFSEIVYAKEPLSKTGDGRGGKKVKSVDTEWIKGCLDRQNRDQ